MIGTQNAVYSIKSLDLGVKEGVVKDYIIRVMDNNDEFIEIMHNGLMKSFM